MGRRILQCMGLYPGGTWLIPGADCDGLFFRAVVPDWVSPSRWEVSDCYWLAYRAYMEEMAGTPGAIAATLAWVCGGATSPVSDRTERPVSREQAVAEMFAAMDVGYGPADYDDVRQEWAERVWRTLHWLAGPARGAPIKQPMNLPVRNVSGAVATADELYAAEIARDKWSYRIMEQKIELRNKAERTASLSRQLDRIVRSTKRAAGVAA